MCDLISRQAAINALKRDEALVRAFGYHNAIDAIIELPSAQPEYTEQDMREQFNVGYACGMKSAEPEAKEIQNNAVHLCDSCQYTYVTCPSHGNDAVFGDGKGNDNICACNKYRPISAQPEQQNFEKQIHAMFDHIWDCEIDHPIFQDTVGDLMGAVIQCHKGLPPAEPDERMLHESCTDCPLYDHERHSCPRFNKVIPEVLREVQSEQRWIPCSERLPEKYIGEWLCCTDDGQILILPYDTPGDGSKECVFYRWDDNGYMYETYNVIAWMPLPQPWERGQDAVN